MILKQMGIALLGVLIIICTGCNGFTDKPLEESVFESDKLGGGCALDPDQFKEFMNKSIDTQIDCLGAKLIDFHSLVKKESPEYIREDELVRFINKFFKDDAKAINQALSLIFELNMILLKDSPDRISVNRIKALVSILKLVNIEVVKLAPIMKRVMKNREEYWQERAMIKASLDRLTIGITQIVASYPGATELNLREFLTNLESKFETLKVATKVINLSTIVKKILVGGQREIMTNGQLVDFLRMASPVAISALDIWALPSIEFDSRDEKMALINSDLEILTQILAIRDAREILLSKTEIIILLRDFDLFTPEIFRIEQAITEIKPLLFGDSGEEFDVGNFRAIFDMAKLGLMAYEVWPSVRDTFKNLNEKSFEEQKKELDTTAKLLKKHFAKVMAYKRLPVIAFSPLNVLSRLNKIFELKLNMNLVDAVISLAPGFIGGREDEITRENFSKAVVILPQLTDLIMDFWAIGQNYSFAQELTFTNRVLDNAARALIQESATFPVVKTSKVATILNELLKNGIDYNDKYAHLAGLKVELLGGSEDQIVLSEIQKLINMGKVAFETLDFYDDLAPLLSDVTTENFENNKVKFEKQIRERLPKLRQLVSSLDPFKTGVNLTKALDALQALFPQIKLTDELILTITTAKDLLIDGPSTKINTEELTSLISKIEVIADPLYTLLFLSESSSTNKLMTLTASLSTILPALSLKGSDATLISISNFARLIDYYTDNAYNLTASQNALLTIKSSLFNQSTRSSDLNRKEMISLLYSLPHLFPLIDLIDYFILHTKEGSSFNVAIRHELFNKIEKIRENSNNILSSGLSFLAQIDLNALLLGITQYYEETAQARPSFLTQLIPLVGVKKLLLGGRKEVLVRSEFQKLIDQKLSLLVQNTYTLTAVNVDQSPLITYDYWYETTSSIKEIRDLIEDKKSEDLLFTTSEILEALTPLVENLNLADFVDAANAVKIRIIKGKLGEFSSKDITQIFNLAIGFAGRFYYSNVQYDSNKNSLEQFLQQVNVTPLVTSYLTDLFTAKELEQHQKDFARIVNNYKFYRSAPSGEQYYFYKPIRRKYGVAEIMSVEFLVGELLKGYGHETKGTNSSLNVAANLQELIAFLVELKPVLVELNLWNDKMNTFARNTLLLTDLFQVQSNGTYSLDKEELTEYLLLVVSAVSISKKFQAAMEKYCTTSQDKFGLPAFNPLCYRKHYFQVLLEDLGYKKYYRALYDYVKKLTEQGRNELLKGIEGFAREVPNLKDLDTTLVNSRELILMGGALLTIDSTIIRFDQNDDGYLSGAEIDRAFKLYEGALLDVACLRGGKEKYARPVFLYMLKYKKPPTTFAAALYTFKTWLLGEDNIKGDRNAIAGILAALVHQSGDSACKK